MVLSAFRSRTAFWIALAAGGGLALVAGCGFFSRRGEDGAFRHATHAAHGITCGACHHGFESDAPAGMPSVGTCLACHGESADRAPYPYERALQARDAATVFASTPRHPDLRFSHAVHAQKAVPCEACHADPDVSAALSGIPREHAARCASCHRERGVDAECATCHLETRRDVPPASHRDLTWFRTHGRDPVHGWDATHARSCSLCHSQSSCDLCHQVEKPQDHTEFFRQRGHGIAVGIERERCTACHQENFCIRCHQETAPRSHFVAAWGGAQSNHCLSCHEPIGDSRCSVCHQEGAPSHLAATRIPPPPHPGAASDCYRCHLRPPHADNGSPCTLCHRA